MHSHLNIKLCKEIIRFIMKVMYDAGTYSLGAKL